MDAGLKKLELTLDEEERLLLLSSGEETIKESEVATVGSLTESDLAKIASLRTLKNKRNHERKRLLKTVPKVAPLVKKLATEATKASGKVVGRSSGGSEKLRAEASASVGFPTLSIDSEKKTEGNRSGSEKLSSGKAPPAAYKRSSDPERLNSQVRQRTRLAVNQPSLSTVLSRDVVEAGSSKESQAAKGSNSKRNRSDSSIVTVVKKQRME
ncbi:unnamed protein product, partial [Diamesa tonsa]